MDTSRRRLLRSLAIAPLAAVCGSRLMAAPSVCNDPASVSISQKNRRKSLGYVEVAPDPRRRCGLCAFYTASQGGCGSCQMLSGGTVDAGSVCNSFAPKPA